MPIRRRQKKPNVEPQQKPKHSHAVVDPMVNPGSPAHRRQARSKADPTRAHHRMVTLAQSSPSDRSARAFQSKKPTVMLVAPKPEFIAGVQETANKNGILVISDEVLNLRQSFEGASARYNLAPDIITMGKIIGGGLPIGAIGSRKDVMEVFDASAGRPLLPQGGTFSANPLSMRAGLAAMHHLDHAAFLRLRHLETPSGTGLTVPSRPEARRYV